MNNSINQQHQPDRRVAGNSLYQEYKELFGPLQNNGRYLGAGFLSRIEASDLSIQPISVEDCSHRSSDGSTEQGELLNIDYQEEKVLIKRFSGMEEKVEFRNFLIQEVHAALCDDSLTIQASTRNSDVILHFRLTKENKN